MVLVKWLSRKVLRLENIFAEVIQISYWLLRSWRFAPLTSIVRLLSIKVRPGACPGNIFTCSTVALLSFFLMFQPKLGWKGCSGGRRFFYTFILREPMYVFCEMFSCNYSWTYSARLGLCCYIILILASSPYCSWSTQPLDTNPIDCNSVQ